MSYLISEGPALITQERIARALGDNEARVIHQLHYWICNPKNTKIYQGRKYTYNTYKELLTQLFFIKRTSLKKIIAKLRNLGILITNQMRHTWGYWYSINYRALIDYLTSFYESLGQMFTPSPELLEMLRFEESPDNTETNDQTFGSQNDPHITEINKNSNKAAEHRHRNEQEYVVEGSEEGGNCDRTGVLGVTEPAPPQCKSHTRVEPCPPTSENLTKFGQSVYPSSIGTTSFLPAFLRNALGKVFKARQSTKNNCIINKETQDMAVYGLDELLGDMDSKLQGRLTKDELMEFVKQYGSSKVMETVKLIASRNIESILNMGGFMRRALQENYYRERTASRAKLWLPDNYSTPRSEKPNPREELGYTRGVSHENDIERKQDDTEKLPHIVALHKREAVEKQMTDSLAGITAEDKLLLAAAILANAEKLQLPDIMVRRGAELLRTTGTICGRVLLLLRKLKSAVGETEEERLREILDLI
jgi:hypothetical protein